MLSCWHEDFRSVQLMRLNFIFAPFNAVMRFLRYRKDNRTIICLNGQVWYVGTSSPLSPGCSARTHLLGTVESCLYVQLLVWFSLLLYRAPFPVEVSYYFSHYYVR